MTDFDNIMRMFDAINDLPRISWYRIDYTQGYYRDGNSFTNHPNPNVFIQDGYLINVNCGYQGAEFVFDKTGKLVNFWAFD